MSPEETTVSVKVIERPRRERGLVTGRRKTEDGGRRTSMIHATH